jgi:3',5'-cyclic AMP phosphodiesterase CpdA
MRLAWIADPHLDHAEPAALRALLVAVRGARADAIAISGDIGQAGSVCLWLERLQAALGMPVYFVLGNHDYYGGSIAKVRGRVMDLCVRVEGLHWLPVAPPVPLGAGTVLVGHDGWADGRAGDFAHSEIELNDYRCIEELIFEDREALHAALLARGDEVAAWARRVLPPLLAEGKDILLLTHAPPFSDACWHEGALSNDDGAPHFTDVALGEALFPLLRAHPDRQLTVLCGHTHSAGFLQAGPNLRVITAPAIYGRPGLAGVIEV